jgi:cell division protein FtsB
MSMNMNMPLPRTITVLFVFIGCLALSSACGGHTRYQLMELSLKTETQAQELASLRTRMDRLEDVNEQLRQKLLDRVK